MRARDARRLDASVRATALDRLEGALTPRLRLLLSWGPPAVSGRVPSPTLLFLARGSLYLSPSESCSLSMGPSTSAGNWLALAPTSLSLFLATTPPIHALTPLIVALLLTIANGRF